jgi:hypothetical protein
MWHQKITFRPVMLRIRWTRPPILGVLHTPQCVYMCVRVERERERDRERASQCARERRERCPPPSTLRGSGTDLVGGGLLVMRYCDVTARTAAKGSAHLMKGAAFEGCNLQMPKRKTWGAALSFCNINAKSAFYRTATAECALEKLLEIVVERDGALCDVLVMRYCDVTARTAARSSAHLI